VRTNPRRSDLPVFLLVLAASCAPVASSSRVDETTTHPAAAPLAPFDACTVYTAREPTPVPEHRTPCSVIDYPIAPPSGGPHYSSWASFLAYDAPVPWGFLVHSLEHGGVVLAYDPGIVEASAVRAAFEEIATARGIDDRCRTEAWPNRIIVVPDPELDWPIAVRAWEHVYDATCLDRPSIEAFIAAHYAHAPENFCFAGVDLSSTGWCP
jgi:hypothetical protein